MSITTRTRCFRVEIETPPDDSSKSIAFHRETVLEENGVIVGLTKSQPASIRLPFLPGLATTVREIADPVTGQAVTISGAGIAAWITAEYEAQLAAEQAAAESARIAAEQAAAPPADKDA
jgi:hypothetical protein